MNNAYVTLLSSEDYLDAVLVLAASLNRVHSRFPLLVAVVEDVYTPKMEYTLKNFGCFVTTISRIEYGQETRAMYEGNSVLNTASKLNLFTLDDYDKLVYMDADTLVLRNMDDLFTYPDGAMLYYSSEPTGTSGLFVFEPRKHQELRYYLSLINNFVVFDGNLLGELWFYVASSPQHQIPSHYFYHYQPETSCPSNVIAVQYCNSPKPWMEPNHTSYSNLYPFARAYKEQLKEVLNQKEKILKRWKGE